MLLSGFRYLGSFKMILYQVVIAIIDTLTIAPKKARSRRLQSFHEYSLARKQLPFSADEYLETVIMPFSEVTSRNAS